MESTHAHESVYTRQKEPRSSVILEFSASEEGDIANYVKAAGDNFRLEYPDVSFEDKLILPSCGLPDQGRVDRRLCALYIHKSVRRHYHMVMSFQAVPLSFNN